MGLGRGQSSETIELFRAEHPNAGLGIVTGPRSRLTVVDIDSVDAAVARDIEQRFGDTPILVATPSGGLHRYYRHSGERCVHRPDGLLIDIKSTGGFVVAPPTQRADRPRPYKFIKGSIGSRPPAADARRRNPSTQSALEHKRHPTRETQYNAL